MGRLVLCWTDYSREGHCYVGYALVPFAVLDIENPEDARMFRFNFPALARVLNTIDPLTFPPYYSDFWFSVVAVDFREAVNELVGFYMEEVKTNLSWDKAEKEALKELDSLPHYRL